MERARYDEVADFYGTENGEVSPALDALLARCGAVRDRTVLDVACGHGVVARHLAESGARVDAIDISAGLLERAEAAERERPLGIAYHLADASARNLLPGRAFDLVVSNFGVTDVDDLDGLLANVSRWLGESGRCVLSLLHPCFGGGGDVSASWPTDGSYFDEGWWRADGERSTLRQVVGSNHRTLSTYVEALASHGLVIESLDEPRPEPEWSASRPLVARQPVYLVITARRRETPRPGRRR